MEKVSRNDPCPCGSGKKFKKCCEAVKAPSKFHLQDAQGCETKIKNIAVPLFKKTMESASLKKETIEEMEKK